MLIEPLVAVGADPAIVPDQDDAPENVPLDHQAVEARHVLRGINPAKEDGISNGRSGVHGPTMSPWIPRVKAQIFALVISSLRPSQYDSRFFLQYAMKRFATESGGRIDKGTVASLETSFL